jgi:hypothetical protein
VTDPYRQLVVLAEREHDLVRKGRFDALEQLDDERRALIATLPATAPTAARPALTEAARVQALTTALLEQARTALAAELSTLQRGQETARGYGRAYGAAPQRETITVAA